MSSSVPGLKQRKFTREEKSNKQSNESFKIYREMIGYQKSVMQRAWQDYNVKKSHKGYEKWNFAQSLYYAHKTIKAIKK